MKTVAEQATEDVERELRKDPELGPMIEVMDDDTMERIRRAIRSGFETTLRRERLHA